MAEAYAELEYAVLGYAELEYADLGEEFASVQSIICCVSFAAVPAFNVLWSLGLVVPPVQGLVEPISRAFEVLWESEFAFFNADLGKVIIKFLAVGAMPSVVEKLRTWWQRSSWQRTRSRASVRNLRPWRPRAWLCPAAREGQSKGLVLISAGGLVGPAQRRAW